MVFNRKQPNNDESRSDAQSELVESLLRADELERKRLLLIALQTGQLKKSEAGDLLRLVERLEMERVVDRDDAVVDALDDAPVDGGAVTEVVGVDDQVSHRPMSSMNLRQTLAASSFSSATARAARQALG